MITARAFVLTSLSLSLSLVAACGGAATSGPGGGASMPAASSALSEGDHTLDVDGLHLAYHVHGHGPVCVAHSGGPGVDWSYLRMPKVEADLTLVYLEAPGTGASSPLPEYSVAHYAEALEKFRGALGLDRMCVLGHSYGGFIAEHWAAAHPDRVAALILYSTRGWVDSSEVPDVSVYEHEPWFPAAAAAYPHEATVAADADADAIYRAEAPLMFADWTHHPEYAAMFASVHAFAGPVRAAANDHGGWDVRPGLAKVHAPTLVIAGAADRFTPPVRAEEIAKVIAGAKQVTLAHSAHMGHVEEPDAFAAAIHAFVASMH